MLILINGGSFSTTSEFLTQVHTRGGATFIGQGSGGAYFGCTSGNQMTLTLPNTKGRLVVPLLNYLLSTQAAHEADRGMCRTIQSNAALRTISKDTIPSRNWRSI
ncbi:hypothetical protein RF679_01240 [Undibacterium cyanobacteriorum]|uniref:Tail specific protease domain-containing protein n=1 Tax=Undibacterium cyanobacteriorum TaxID=3073561 RepID=A0ABY9RKX5_9BURK|nr:hypothetical protein [Undibacterium sp. 20NA77.5]WMW80920.1 hypothetical protein RF679_01240 [Undibacterium sp. 20NA77.5]